jgi:hypothetical protein
MEITHFWQFARFLCFISITENINLFPMYLSTISEPHCIILYMVFFELFGHFWTGDSLLNIAFLQIGSERIEFMIMKAEVVFNFSTASGEDR